MKVCFVCYIPAKILYLGKIRPKILLTNQIKVFFESNISLEVNYEIA